MSGCAALFGAVSGAGVCVVVVVVVVVVMVVAVAVGGGGVILIVAGSDEADFAGSVAFSPSTRDIASSSSL